MKGSQNPSTLSRYQESRGDYALMYGVMLSLVFYGDGNGTKHRVLRGGVGTVARVIQHWPELVSAGYPLL